MLAAQDVSDRVESEPEDGELRLTLERRAAAVVGTQWDAQLDKGEPVSCWSLLCSSPECVCCADLLDNLGKYRKYNYGSVRDCLRVIRSEILACVQAF